MSFVQAEESSLENKRQHCECIVFYIRVALIHGADVNVVKAFETALALLGGP